MQNYLLASLLLFALAAATRGAEQSAPISVTIAAHVQPGGTLGDTKMEIHITNATDHRVTIQTMDALPPVSLGALDEKGNMAIIDEPAPKDRTTRHMQYTLEPNETKDYEAPVRELLRRGQRWPDEASSGEVRIDAFLPIVTETEKSTSVTLIKSNTVKVKIAARAN